MAKSGRHYFLSNELSYYQIFSLFMTQHAARLTPDPDLEIDSVAIIRPSSKSYSGATRRDAPDDSRNKTFGLQASIKNA
jgi:hypothetical protein